MVIVLCNLALISLIMIGIWPIFTMMENQQFEGLLFLFVLIPLLVQSTAIVTFIMSIIADFKQVKWTDIPRGMKSNWKSCLFFSTLIILLSAIFIFGVNYYFSLNNMIGVLAGAILFWFNLSVYLSMIWFFAVQSRLGGNFLVSLKKCMLIMLDNLGLSFFTGFIMIPLQLILWPLTAFIAFGPTGIQLYCNVAIRLLMYKYDWMEEHPKATKKDIPWCELLVEEQERIGERTLKGIIFPWKE